MLMKFKAFRRCKFFLVAVFLVFYSSTCFLLFDMLGKDTTKNGQDYHYMNFVGLVLDYEIIEMEWFGFKGTFKDQIVQLPCHG